MSFPFMTGFQACLHRRGRKGILGALFLLVLPPTFALVAGEPGSEIAGIEILKQQVGDTTYFSLRNSQLAELTVGFDLMLRNLVSNVQLPLELVIPPQTTTAPLVVLHPAERGKPWNYDWRYHFTWGSSLARHDPTQVYRLPFHPGRSFRVLQGQDGGFSHTGEARFAIDFGMPEGTQVLAARDGLVVMTSDGFEAGGANPDLKEQTNEIFLRHDDGTIGEYLHLLKGGIKVQTGDRVRAGQLVAVSGNSGYTSGPHLHFMVFRARDSRSRESLPIKFLTREGCVALEEEHSYAAPDEGAQGSMQLNTR